VPALKDIYQLALDNAEHGRNYVNEYTQAVSDRNTGNISDPSKTGKPIAMMQGPKAYGLYGAPNDYDTEEMAEAQLARVKQFDPNASISYRFESLGGEGGGQPKWTVNFDRDKLPALGGDAQAAQGKGARLAGFGGYGAENLYNKDNVVWDENYGALTDNRNIDTRKTDDEGLMKYAPLVVMALATMGAAAPALAAGAGFMEAVGGASLGAAGNAMFAAPGVINNINNGNYLGAGASILGAGLGAAGYGTAGQLVSKAPGIYNAARAGDYTGAALSAASPVLGAAGVNPMLTTTGTTLANIYRQRARTGKGG